MFANALATNPPRWRLDRYRMACNDGGGSEEWLQGGGGTDERDWTKH